MNKPTINLSAPLNSLSFGHHAINLLEEFHKRGREVNLFLPQQPDISAYNVSADFKKFIENAANNALGRFSIDDPSIKLWHLNGSEHRTCRNQHLLAVHELDNLTRQEVNILRQQQTVFTTSRYSEELYNTYGIENVIYCPLGFDSSNFKTLPRKNKEGITFGLFGKFEKRKNTQKVISTWLKKYSKSREVSLNLHVTNPHFSPEDNQKLIAGTCGGYKPFNVNVLPFFASLQDYNAAINDCDIVIDMSGAEGFSIPSFTAVALGKHAVIHNCTAMTDWATNSGAVLVESSGKEVVYDGVFFQQGQPFNQGNIFTWKEEDFIEGCEEAMRRFKKEQINHQGLTLQERFSWEKNANIIIERIDALYA